MSYLLWVKGGKGRGGGGGKEVGGSKGVGGGRKWEAEEAQHVSRIADSVCPFCIGSRCKKGTLSQHFVTRVVPPLGERR